MWDDLQVSCVFFFDTLEPRRLLAVDLVCYGVQIDSFDPNTLLISYTISIANTGSSDTPFDGGGGIFLSKNLAVNDRDDVTLNGIGPSDTPHLSNKILIGSGLILGTIAPGDYYLGAALDIQSHVEEPNNDNNYAFSANTINIPQMYNLGFDGTDKADTMNVSGSGNEIGIGINQSGNDYPRDRIASLTLNGLSGNDVISLLPTLDLPVVINGGDGHDSINGGGAGDTINGGKGRDTIHGGGGRDIIHGGADIDLLFGESKGDRIWGDAGNDSIDGGGGEDRLDGGGGVDSIYGSGGNDIITARDGAADVIYGGSDSDQADLDPIDFRSGVEVVT